jgi:hypothetical protein
VPEEEHTSDRSDAASDSDRLLELADEIVILSAHLQAGTQRLLELLAEFDRKGGWLVDGHRTCAHWLAHHTGIDLGAAREKVRVARALEELPETRAVMSRGELSFAKVRALSRVATPETESDLLDYARGASAAGVERLVRSWRREGLDEEALDRERHRSRRLTVLPDNEGMYVVRGRVSAEVGAVLVRALEAGEDALFRARGQNLTAVPAGTNPDGGPVELSAEAAAALDPLSSIEPMDKPRQRRADALGLLAERALAAGFGALDDDPAEGAAENDPAPISGSRAERYQMVVHVDRATLEAGAGASALGISELEDGTRVSAETSRRLACDASIVEMTHQARGVDAPAGDGCAACAAAGHANVAADIGAGDTADEAADPTAAPTFSGTLTHLGSVLDLGRRSRTISPALRRALEFRDGGCRFPGCGLAFTEGHHIWHWADGGPTSLDNLVLVCRRHHGLVHEGRFRVEMGPTGQPNFYNPRGIPLPDVPPPTIGGSAIHLLRHNRARGVSPDHRTGRTRWPYPHHIPLDIAERAWEAAARGDDEGNRMDGDSAAGRGAPSGPFRPRGA